jgi:hypothetical protein
MTILQKTALKLDEKLKSSNIGDGHLPLTNFII